MLQIYKSSRNNWPFFEKGKFALLTFKREYNAQKALTAPLHFKKSYIIILISLLLMVLYFTF